MHVTLFCAGDRPRRRSSGTPSTMAAAVIAITHPLGMPAGGTHTEVAFVDDTSTELPERLVDDLVRQIGNRMYPGSWAFHYRPNRVPDAVLQYGSLLRERIEVSAVEVWDA
jgi:hypothetical protein